MWNLRHICVIFLTLTIFACDAPRDNPYDPESGNYIGPVGEIDSVGSISGTVTSLGFIALPNVLVLTSPGYIGAVTNSNGDYLIEGISAGDYQVFCNPEGFEPDTLDISVNIGQVTEADFRLDALPVIEDFQVISQFVHQINPPVPPEYHIIFAQTLLTEPDGLNDIVSVTLHIEDFLDTLMSYNPDSSSGGSFYYDFYLPEEQFPYGNVDSIRWKHFSCTVEDTSGNSSATEPIPVMRFFETYPIPTSPIDDEVVGPPEVALIWEEFDQTFFFTYDVRVYREIGSNVYSLFWQQSGISASVTTVTVNSSFVNDEYYWELWVFDEYENSARSAKAHFVYQQ
ncbi:hypothetical protein CEE37_11350 [candidate division LCP-89 bacterium B3_LCP]|uniref:Carboxypeptidase regulatory-like domain-containing protein n=1 Tax=candidate division LCP-89 bacterium B3_LCP TaxID=2012998 RepID=A0A532UVP6_UNCL8|nr:MAG: hypothetical protein CEE37_11350 [candidate division LCP-89 bacterium B3_LCP]